MRHTLPFLGTVSPVPVVRLALVREGGASYVGEPIRSPADAAALLSPHLQDASREVVLALLLLLHAPARRGAEGRSAGECIGGDRGAQPSERCAEKRIDRTSCEGPGNGVFQWLEA